VDVAEGITAAIVGVTEAAGARTEDASSVTGSTGGVFRALEAQAFKKNKSRIASAIPGATLFPLLMAGL
jgi:hypothetical protein